MNGAERVGTQTFILSRDLEPARSQSATPYSLSDRRQLGVLRDG